MAKKEIREKHIIARAVFDLSFAPERAEAAEADVLGALIQQQLLGVVESVFESVSQERAGVIEQLTLDLGVIDAADFQEALKDRLRLRLKAALEAQLPLRSTPALAAGFRSHVSADSGALETLLTRGYLPSNQNLPKGRTMNEWVKAALTRSSEDFADFLKKTKPQSPVFKRLIYQCSGNNLVGIARLLAPGQSQDLAVRVKNLKAVLAECSGLHLKNTNLAHEIWTRLFEILLAPGGASLSSNLLFDRIVRKISRKKGLSEKEMLKARSKLNLPDRAMDSARILASTQEKGEGEALKALAKLKKALRRAVTEAKPDAIKAMWQDVLHNHRRLLKDILMDHGRILRVRRALSRQFSDGMLADIVHVIDPEASPFIHEIVSRPSLFQQIKQAESEVKYQLWEFTLSYLIVERGSYFNKKAYLESLIAQMAAHENRAYVDVLQILITQLDEVSLPNHVKNEMGDLLATLFDEDVSGKKTEPLLESDTASDPSTLIQAYAQLEVLRKALWGYEGDQQKVDKQRREQPDEAGIIAAIDALIRFEPQLLLQFFRRLRMETKTASILKRRLSAPVMLRLMHVLLSLRRPGEQGFPDLVHKDFMQAVAVHADRANDVRSFYAQILIRLIHNEEIDFERMLEGNTRLRQTISDAADVPEKSDFSRSDAAASRALRTRISGALAQGRFRDIEAFWPDLLGVNGDWLRETFLVLGRQSAVRKKLAAHFPDDMLIDLVALVTPEAATLMQGIAAQPRLFRSISRIPQETEGEVKAQFWEFTLTYLIAERGSRFNQKSYLSSLMTQMAAHHNRSRQGVLIALTTALETLEASSSVKSEILLILRELSQESQASEMDKKTLETKTSSDSDTYEQDAGVMCKTVEAFLTQGVWPEKTAAQTGTSLSEIIERLFCSHSQHLFGLFDQLSRGKRLETAHALRDSEGVYLRLIEIFLSRSGGLAPPDFMQAVMRHAEEAAHRAVFFQHVFACLIEKRCVDFEAILMQNAGEEDTGSSPVFSSDVVREARASSETVLESASKTAEVSASDLNPPEAAVAARSLKAALDLLEKTLCSAASLSSEAVRSFIENMRALLGRSPKDLLNLFNRLLQNPRVAARLIHLLPEPILVRVLQVMRPKVFDALLFRADCIASAASAKEVALSPERITRLKWQFIFQYLFEEGRCFNARDFVRLFTETLAKDAYYADVRAFRLLLRAELESHLLWKRKAEVLDLMDRLTHPEEVKSSQDEKALSAEAGQNPDEAEEIRDESIYLENAGLVIAAPYLPRLFDLLNLTEGQAFKNLEAAMRSVHLLQFLVDESTESPEYRLVLNKVLCGLRPELPIEGKIRVSAQEKEVIEGLIRGMIANWKQIGQTSIQGFRESFLQREGTLRRKSDDWQVEVLPKGFDILLDYIPWNFSVVKLPWMSRVIHVKWRNGGEG